MGADVPHCTLQQPPPPPPPFVSFFGGAGSLVAGIGNVKGASALPSLILPESLLFSRTATTRGSGGVAGLSSSSADESPFGSGASKSTYWHPLCLIN
eukprot:CAMPEP_0119516084 /NCGR_PEP_ID=MMETSP1344-20130328/33376_1 /TAXON_ID=236787 /ORGANISM="Florenciella parvula, Strain CCMP2471" /LENGTH=96 /DNA_ID=CAMNT_0007553547 /DNA_START=651 /DNA_END=938 /DNA_ORIENTATION=-